MYIPEKKYLRAHVYGLTRREGKMGGMRGGVALGVELRERH